MRLPDYAIQTLKEEYSRLDRSFSRIWGALSPSDKRDHIMQHILAANILISELIKQEEEEQ